MLARRSPCRTSDQEKSSASGFLLLSSFCCSYFSSLLGKKSNSEKNPTRAQGPRLWWAFQLFPLKPAMCYTRPARAQRELSLKLCVYRVHLGTQAPTVRWVAAQEVLPRSWCVRLPTPLYLEESATRSWGAEMVTKAPPVRSVRYVKPSMTLCPFHKIAITTSLVSTFLGHISFCLYWCDIIKVNKLTIWSPSKHNCAAAFRLYYDMTVIKIPSNAVYYLSEHQYLYMSISSAIPLLFWWSPAQFLLIFGRY